MVAFARAALAAALVLLLSVAGFAADKSFRRNDLADAAIKLEAQIKAEAGQVTKPAAALRREADAAFQRNDFRTGMQILGQIVVVAPEDSANWLRLARAVLQFRPSNEGERTLLLERAATAAYIAYQRSSDPGEEAQSLVVLARTYVDRSIWRPALDALMCSSICEKSRRSGRNMSASARIMGSGCSTTASMPMRRPPGSAFSSPRTSPSRARISRRSSQSPARTSRRYRRRSASSAWRGSSTASVRHYVARRHSVGRGGETLARSAEFNVYVRDRKPLRAIHQQGLCPAARRPARNPGGQRQHHECSARNLPHRRPQSPRHRARLRFSARARPLRHRIS